MLMYILWWGNRVDSLSNSSDTIHLLYPNRVLRYIRDYRILLGEYKPMSGTEPFCCSDDFFYNSSDGVQGVTKNESLGSDNIPADSLSRKSQLFSQSHIT